ncbi:MAG: ATP phosphoribosyltransferase [Gemmatimonadaceae bacterium]|nr:ATP phosphoribosyltransferase [Gemmatimonadaceae bacterium]
MLKIAIPNKGRLSDDARELFNDAGLEVRQAGERALTASLGGEFEALFVRAQDIPEFVADGAADAGVTGLDLVRESGRALTEELDLRFGKCRLVVAVRDESPARTIADLAAAPAPRVATVFPHLTSAFFTEQGISARVVPVSGAAEIAPHLGIADIVVDLTSTGSTLRMNGMREIGTVLTSSARLISGRNVAEDATKRVAMRDLALALESVIRARGQRYVMANVPRTALDRVKTILPGINGPTVLEIANGGAMVAVHAVVRADLIYRTIAQLQELGGEGILVTRIERLA